MRYIGPCSRQPSSTRRLIITKHWTSKRAQHSHRSNCNSTSSPRSIIQTPQPAGQATRRNLKRSLLRTISYQTWSSRESMIWQGCRGLTRTVELQRDHTQTLTSITRLERHRPKSTTILSKVSREASLNRIVKAGNRSEKTEKTTTFSTAMQETSLDKEMDQARDHKEAPMDHNTVNRKAVGSSTAPTVALTSRKELKTEPSPSLPPTSFSAWALSRSLSHSSKTLKTIVAKRTTRVWGCQVAAVQEPLVPSTRAWTSRLLTKCANEQSITKTIGRMSLH